MSDHFFAMLYKCYIDGLLNRLAWRKACMKEKCSDQRNCYIGWLELLFFSITHLEWTKIFSEFHGAFSENKSTVKLSGYYTGQWTIIIIQFYMIFQGWEWAFYFIFFQICDGAQVAIMGNTRGAKLGFHPRGSKKWAIIIHNNNKMHKDVGAHPQQFKHPPLFWTTLQRNTKIFIPNNLKVCKGKRKHQWILKTF